MFQRLLALGTVVCSSLLTSVAFAGAHQAPPPFTYQNHLVVPVDFEEVTTTFIFDVASGTQKARATVEFTALGDGWPMFDLVPAITSASFDGASMNPSSLPEISVPSNTTTVRIIKQDVTAGSRHTLSVEYTLDFATISSGSVNAGFFMSDLDDRQYWEQYGLANFEYDQFHMKAELSVVGTTAAHEIFTNGELTSLGTNHWSVDFPSYFTASSFFLHLTKTGRFQVARGVFQGKAKEIPLTVYATSQSLSTSALSHAKETLAELEGTYGAFAHAKVVLYMSSNPFSGGMEYCGGAVTSMDALEHELTHSWFARGVMPSSGNSGWIDEAVASWRDDGYQTAAPSSRSPQNLGGFSPYRRHTTNAAYTQGEYFIRELDYVFKAKDRDGFKGMKGQLRAFFGLFQRKTISMQDLVNFLKSETTADIEKMFERYALGKDVDVEGFYGEDFIHTFETPKTHRRHPRPFTQEEMRQMQ